MKILYVTTISNTMGFFTSHINMLLDKGHTVDMACNLVKPINSQLIERGCKIYQMDFSRTPLNRTNYKAYKDLKKLILEEKYDLVHTHTPVASAITRLVCKNIKGTKVFYTAHGFHFHKGAPIKNWLIYYPLEKWLAKYTDTLITINKEDYERAKSKFKAKRVEYIPGVGLDIDKFNSQYAPVDVVSRPRIHDRFLIVDGKDVYHIGASMKDLGKKMFAFSKMEINADVIMRYLDK